jgi:hypothetical protein
MLPARPEEDCAPQLVVSLIDQLGSHTGIFGPSHPQTLTVLHQLAIALWNAGDIGQAEDLLNQALDCLTSACGSDHPAALAVTGDLAAVLFELGQDEEAAAMEREAFESARTHLGQRHSVTTVLAWNRALSCEFSGQLDAARKIFADDLVWLLVADPASLESDQNTIRNMLAERFHWDAAQAC